jgi:hypothetical protein
VLAALCLSLPPSARAQDGKGDNAKGDNPHGQLPKGLDCSSCHTANGWHELKNPLAFDHAQVTGFPLTGQHATVTCNQCHLGLRYDQVHVAAADCVGCHVDVHQGRLEGACSRCHNTSGFQEVPAVALHARSGFPLTGAHLQAPCESCHRNDQGGAFAPIAADCMSCHRQDYTAASMPDHATTGFPTNCEQCHTTLTWQGSGGFDHASFAKGFALVGAHATIQCADCHIPPNGALRFSASGQNDCVACHQAQFNSAHSGTGFPTSCTDCHNINSWANATFDHSKFGFALLGAHAQLQCSNCHIQPGNALKFTQPSGQNDCVACHQADYNRVHSGSGFSTNCTDCHTVNNWNANFDHTSFFPLTGSHAASCATCHTTPGTYSAFTCFQCHEHNQTDMNSKHQGVNGYSYDSNACYRCHPTGRSGG